MSTMRSLSITLPLEMVQMVQAKVSSGEYASESEVVQDGLLTLADQDAAIDQWMRDEVLPTLDALDADPSSAVSAKDAWQRIEAHMERNSQENDRK